MGTQKPSDNELQLDDALKRRLEECADTNGVSAAQIVREALEEYLATRASNGNNVGRGPNRTLFEVAGAITASVPKGEWAKIPVDLAMNFEHHRYGYPREE